MRKLAQFGGAIPLDFKNSKLYHNFRVFRQKRQDLCDKVAKGGKYEPHSRD